MMAILSVSSTNAAETPSYEQAVQFTKSLERAFGATRAWDAKTARDKIRQLETGLESLDEAKMIFGNDPLGSFGDCLLAPLILQVYIFKLSDMFDKQSSVRRSKSSEIDELISHTYKFGVSLEACKQQIRVLQTK